MFKRVLVGMDGSAEALRAAQQAWELGIIAEDAELDLIGALPERPWPLGLDEDPTEAREAFQRRALSPARAALAEVGVSGGCELVASGAASAVIAERAAEGYDLVVVGRQGWGRVKRWMLGSVSAELLPRSPAPVLVVPWTDDAPAKPEGRPLLLVPTDASACAAQGEEAAFELARELGAELVLLSVVPREPGVELAPEAGVGSFLQRYEQACARYVKEVEARLEARAHELRGHGVEARGMVRRGDVAAEVAAACEALGARLVVMASHGRSGFQELMLGSQASRLLREARCPVLVIKSRAPELTEDDLP